MTTRYALRMAALSARIFGEVPKPVNEKSMRVVQLLSEPPVNKNPEFVNYYPNYYDLGFLQRKLRFFGIYRDEYEEFKKMTSKARKSRGKSPPQKGQGKRAAKRSRAGGK